MGLGALNVRRHQPRRPPAGFLLLLLPNVVLIPTFITGFSYGARPRGALSFLARFTLVGDLISRGLPLAEY